jgi:hypothetical protein
MAPIWGIQRALSVAFALPSLPRAEQGAGLDALSRYVDSDSFPLLGSDGSEEKSCLLRLRREGDIGLHSRALEDFQRILQKIDDQQKRRLALDPQTDLSYPLTTSPLFSAGPVRFFQSGRVSEQPYQIQAGEPLFEYPSRWQRWWARRQLPAGERKTWEEWSNRPPIRFSSFRESFETGGALLVGETSLQGLALASRLRASQVVFVGNQRTSTLNLVLYLLGLTYAQTREEYAARASGLFRKKVPAMSYLEKIPEPYRPAFASHIDQLRSKYPAEMKESEKSLAAALVDGESLLGNPSFYDYGVNLVRAGGVSILYGQDMMRAYAADGSPLGQELTSVLKGTEDSRFENIYLGAAGDERHIFELGFGPEALPLSSLMRSSVVGWHSRLLFASCVYREPAGKAEEEAWGYYAPFCRDIPDLLAFYGGFRGLPLHYDRYPKYTAPQRLPFR